MILNEQWGQVSYSLCEDEPCKTYESELPSQYVLELRGNRAEELNLKPGDTIFFSL